MYALVILVFAKAQISSTVIVSHCAAFIHTTELVQNNYWYNHASIVKGPVTLLFHFCINKACLVCHGASIKCKIIPPNKMRKVQTKGTKLIMFQKP